MTELELHILLALAEGPAHGYAIGKDIAERTGGRLNPTTGSLYQAIRRLTDDERIRACAAPEGTHEARRNYFRLTPGGRRAAAEEIRKLEAIVAVGRARRLLNPGGVR